MAIQFSWSVPPERGWRSSRTRRSGLCGPVNYGDRITALSWSSRDDRLAVVCADGTLRVIDVHRDYLALTTQAHVAAAVDDVTWCNDLVVTAGNDRRVQLWSELSGDGRPIGLGLVEFLASWSMRPVGDGACCGDDVRAGVPVMTASRSTWLRTTSAIWATIRSWWTRSRICGGGKRRCSTRSVRRRLDRGHVLGRQQRARTAPRHCLRRAGALLSYEVRSRLEHAVQGEPGSMAGVPVRFVSRPGCRVTRCRRGVAIPLR